LSLITSDYEHGRNHCLDWLWLHHSINVLFPRGSEGGAILHMVRFQE
jgi:hypothetical protein